MTSTRVSVGGEGAGGEGPVPPEGSLAERAARFWRASNRLAEVPPGHVVIGATPAEAVLRYRGMTLWRYRASQQQSAAPPLLIVHGFIGRAGVTDLTEDRSLVAELVAHGIDVYTIHWGSPSRADRYQRIEDYLDDHLDACIAHVRSRAGLAPVLFGICEGGVFSVCHAALEPSRVSGLALAVTPIDCHADSDAVVTRWIRAFSTEELTRLLSSLGCLPGCTIGAVFQAMTPARTMAKYTGGLAAMADEPHALRLFLQMETWLRDRPDHPAEAARQLLVEHYHENRLARGVWKLGGRRVNLAALQMPVFSAYGLRDHLVPPPCARAIQVLAPRACHTDCPLDAGHIGVFVSRRARGMLAARLSEWLLNLDAG